MIRQFKAGKPLSERATGLWFRTPGGLMQRYEEATPSPQGLAHWYLGEPMNHDGWHVYLETQVKPYVPVRKRLRQRKVVQS